FIWLGEKHAEALASFQYGLQDSKPILLLTGDVGTGKTALINVFLTKLDDNVIAVKIPDPGMGTIDFYHILTTEFNLNKKFITKGDFLNHLSPYLHEINRQNKIIILIIDEAQNISNELLEEIRLLSNIELADTKLINIFMVGQNELDPIVDQNRNRGLRQRISVRYHLEPIDASETYQYIRHRLRVAGAEKDIFSSKAISDIHFFSAGFPRLINSICDLALLTGYSRGELDIDEKIIKECAQDLKLSGDSKNIEKPDSTQCENEGLAAKKFHSGGRTLKLLLVISGIIMIVAFLLIYALYRNHNQTPTISEEAYQNYRHFEDEIDRPKLKFRPDDNELVRNFSAR
ncbi:MAG: AAA family ATPase, partial [Desulfobacterales bacterium]